MLNAPRPAETLMGELETLVAEAKGVPLSHRVRVERERLAVLLDELRVAMPAELREARALVGRGREVLADTTRECERMLRDSRDRAASAGSETAVARVAERAADELLSDALRAARVEADAVDAGAEDTLALLESSLEHFRQAVQRDRQRTA